MSAIFASISASQSVQSVSMSNEAVTSKAISHSARSSSISFINSHPSMYAAGHMLLIFCALLAMVCWVSVALANVGNVEPW